MWLMKPQIHRNASYSWAAFGPLQIIWNRPDHGPLLWLTTDPPRLLSGRFW
jgi:hypothetical protein